MSGRRARRLRQLAESHKGINTNTRKLYKFYKSKWTKYQVRK